MSAICAHCGKVKRLRMRLDRDGRPEYLCRPCGRELEGIDTARRLTQFVNGDTAARIIPLTCLPR